jgi:cellulose synthase (UDP-forming)
VRQSHIWDGRQLIGELRNLVSVFDAQLSTFERKRFVNLSREANKAMNLNTYLGLMGRSWTEREGQEGSYLVPGVEGDVDLHIPATKYVITLDADSILLNDYALRLVAVMETEGNERIAVAQTPYSAFPGAPKLLERVAGATTDIQHYVHQGSSQYQGAFWVGANALIRHEALEDIAEQKTERGFPVTVYIQNRTVIEDTESSVDLVRKNWRIYNYLDRLAYSETPSDFGSLLIQRRRWANGGLIILPKLLRYCASGKCGLGEAVTRFQYLTSPTTTNVALLLLLLLPLDESLASIWLPIAAAPYFGLYGLDLVRAGYKWTDIPRVYALNVLLAPVNLGGVLKSLQQVITGRRTPFGRTPKVSTRTAVPPIYVISIFAILVIAALNAITGAMNGYWIRFGFSFLNCVVLSYVVIRFIGIGAAWDDLRFSQAKASRPIASSRPQQTSLTEATAATDA